MTQTAMTRMKEMQKRIVLPYCRLCGGLWWELISKLRSGQLRHVQVAAGRHYLLEKNGVAGIVRTSARKSRGHLLPPVAEVE